MKIETIPGYTEGQTHDMSVPERALQWAAYLCDKVKAREVGGNNHGPMVREFLKSVGLGEGYPWCAAFVTYCLRKAGWLKFPRRPAAVSGWKEWATSVKALVARPTRGCLCYRMNSDGTGHIGFVVKDMPFGWVASIEGNTSSGNAGSQRDGDGVFRRIRHRSYWTGFIDLEQAE